MSLSGRLLGFLIDQATRNRDSSAAVSKQSASNLQASKRTQQSLAEFSEQKNSERRNAVDQSTGINAAIGHARFSGKLETAMSLQAEQVAQSEAAFEETRIELSERQRELHALQLLEKRKNNREKRKARQAERKKQDEIAARKTGRNEP
ncbi:MAG: flagellar export protein FliJ [Gammaproteobacteria bacterium]|nr:flagellar export protein FliJ [Gammaproteobacteria bacterium]